MTKLAGTLSYGAASKPVDPITEGDEEFRSKFVSWNLAEITYVEIREYLKEKDNLRIMRNAIELYAAQHNGVPPGYNMGDTGSPPIFLIFRLQLTWASNATGGIAPIGTPGFPLGPYISAIPSNPFNNLNTASVLLNDDEFPAEATGEYGWVYQPRTKTIKLDWTGTDEKGVRYYDY